MRFLETVWKVLSPRFTCPTPSRSWRLYKQREVCELRVQYNDESVFLLQYRNIVCVCFRSVTTRVRPGWWCSW